MVLGLATWKVWILYNILIFYENIHFLYSYYYENYWKGSVFPILI